LREECEEQAKKAWKALESDPSQMDFPGDSLEGSYEFDKFPYPIWQFWRLKHCRPDEVYLLFLEYKDCMRQSHVSGQSFFNYCKTVLYHARREAGDLLVAEVQSLEAEVRFFAGTYYALFTGVWIVSVSLVTQLALYRSELVQFKPPTPRTFNFWLAVLLLIYHVHDEKGDPQTIQNLAHQRSGHATGRVLPCASP
jgi:hypothetical protein